MKTDPSTHSASLPPALPAESDLTGRERLAGNVVSSWLAYGAFIVGGFVLPRMIDTRIGREGLGVWDLGWSIVGHFILVQGGVVSSINRYVAFYRSRGDTEGVNRVVSSVSCLLVLMAGLILALSLGTALALPHLFGDKLGGYLNEARWLVLLLGAGLSVQTASWGFAGTLTGVHRWDLHNAIQAGTYFVGFFAMVGALALGGSLPSLALANLGGQVLGAAVRCVAAFRVCPSLRIAWSLVSRQEMRDALTFGSKSFLPEVAGLAVRQTSSVLILLYLGPAALALYTRPRALVRHVRTLTSKLSFVLTPISASLQSTDRVSKIAELMIQANRSTVFFTLPLVLLFVFVGDSILTVWMGPDYTGGAAVLTALGLASLLSMTQQSVRSVLVGMNAHGRPGVASLLASALSLVVLVIVLGPLGGGLLGAALAVSIPIALSDGLYVTIYACDKLNLRVAPYLVSVWRGPLLCALPFGVCLLTARWLFEEPTAVLAGGIIVGGVVLLTLYWLFVIPENYRKRIRGALMIRRAAKP